MNILIFFVEKEKKYYSHHFSYGSEIMLNSVIGGNKYSFPSNKCPLTVGENLEPQKII